MSSCIICGKELDGYDIGFYRKMVNRGAQEYACIECMCKKIEITEHQAWEMILDMLSGSLTETAYNTWFADCTAIELGDNQLVLHTTSSV
ncbi:MAG: hypothetical protein IJK34_03215, partial [Clostridia bacterium]|nr:hypothetical protein [Clostridia bacterium]